ncbi:hypothetical protein BR93DRAFT_930473 [Coniochaeta sp. PMI_546]|nr:hypothetical protein BR93DRAFT_930473 [Coniochaeta sp. PMI_546]
MSALGRRRLVLPAAAVLLTIITFFYLLSPSQLRQPLTVPNQESLPSDIPIPRQIWQIFFPPPGAATLKKSTFFSADWIAMAPGYTYTMVADQEAASLIDTYFADRPEIGTTFHALTNPALKSDFLRYLLLSARGGTYSDVDTKPLVPLESWLPASLRGTTRLVIALEYDETQDTHTDQTAHEVQFCQWTISSAPNHPLMARMVDRALADLQAAARAQNTDVAHAVFSDKDVLNTTGPVAWSENVFEVLRERDPSVRSWLDFTGIREPRHFGDIVLLPLESFRADWRDDWGTWFNWRKGRRALVRHFYKGGWRVVKLPGQE